MVEYCVMFKTRQASVTPTFEIAVKFISRDGWVLCNV